MEFRAKLTAAMEADPKLRQGIVNLCREDILFWINAFVWQYNPKKKKKQTPVGPFSTWDFQDELILLIVWCVENDEDLVMLKSRQMGASWICIIVLLWLWLFRADQQLLCMSRNAEVVDGASRNSLFKKIRFILQRLPACLKPSAYRDKEMHLGNTDNGSEVDGEASTKRAGVGGNDAVMFIDEFSQIQEAYEVLHRTSDTAYCRIFNFTFTGVDNAAYEISKPSSNYRKFMMHWSQHPDRNRGAYRVLDGKVQVLDKSYKYPVNFDFVLDGSPTGGPFPGLRSPWYDLQCKRKGNNSRAVAMDLDINAQGAQSQFFDALKIRWLQATYCTAAVWEGDVAFDANGIVKRLEPRKGGPLQLWIQPEAQGGVPAGSYGFGVDCATGKAKWTPSCLSMINAQTGEKVGVYRSVSIEPEDFACMTVGLCKMFHNARLCWECPGPGMSFGRRVIELGYRNFYYRQNEGRLIPGQERETPGWWNDPKSKLVLLREYKEALEACQFLNRSKPGLEECLSFEYLPSGYVEHGGIEAADDPSGAQVNHGDECMADAMAWRVSSKTWKGRQEAVKKTKEVQPMSMLWRRQLREMKEKESEAWA